MLKCRVHKVWKGTSNGSVIDAYEWSTSFDTRTVLANSRMCIRWGRGPVEARCPDIEVSHRACYCHKRGRYGEDSAPNFLQRASCWPWRAPCPSHRGVIKPEGKSWTCDADHVWNFQRSCNVRKHPGSTFTVCFRAHYWVRSWFRIWALPHSPWLCEFAPCSLAGEHRLRSSYGQMKAWSPGVFMIGFMRFLASQWEV